MWNADPLILEFVGKLNAVAELFPQVFKIETVQLLGGGVLLDGLMRGLFENRKECLTHHGGVDVVHAGSEDLAPHQWILFLFQQLFVHDHFGENRRSFRQRKRGVLGQNRVVFGHHAVDGMAQFVGDGGDVTHLVGIVQQDVGG